MRGDVNVKFGFNKRKQQDEVYEDELYDDEFYEDDQYEESELDEEGYSDTYQDDSDDYYNGEIGEFDEPLLDEPDDLLDDGLTLDDIDEADATDGHNYVATKWYESMVNVVLASVVVGSLLVGVWYFAGDSILGMLGVGQNYLQEQDLGGRLERYQQDIQAEIDGVISPTVETEQEANINITPVDGEPAKELADSAGPGTYFVGVDIKPGNYLMGIGSTYSKYPDEYALMNDDPIESTRDAKRSDDGIVHKPTKTNKVHTLVEGTYIVIEEGGMVYNNTRTPRDMKINESAILLKGNHYTVGIDIPAGYYKVIATKRRTGTAIKIQNPNEELQLKEYKADRQTYAQLIRGNIIEVTQDSILTRVDMSFVY